MMFKSDTYILNLTESLVWQGSRYVNGEYSEAELFVGATAVDVAGLP